MMRPDNGFGTFHWELADKINPGFIGAELVNAQGLLTGFKN
jgi:hypothetical protein